MLPDKLCKHNTSSHVATTTFVTQKSEPKVPSRWYEPSDQSDYSLKHVQQRGPVWPWPGDDTSGPNWGRDVEGWSAGRGP